MTDSGLKKLLGFVLRNKQQLITLFDRFRAEDVERGILAIPQDLINRDLKMFIMEKADPYLTDYTITFDNGSVFVVADADLKQLGKVKARYQFTVESFTFRQLVRKVTLHYQEDVKPNGSMLQNLAMKAAGLKGSYLQTAAEIARLPFLSVADHRITVDLDKIDLLKKVPSELSLSYDSCAEGTLKLNFHID